MQITDQFNAFKAVVIADYPYEVGDAFNKSVVIDCFADTYSEVVRQHSKIQNNYFSRNGEGYINLAYLDHFLILCLRLSKGLGKCRPVTGRCDLLFLPREDINGCLLPH